MRRVLILGGTGWLGREIVDALMAQGDEVVCLARGMSGTVPEGARLVVADRDDPNAYNGVVGVWDEVIEMSYGPVWVESALAALADGAGHWLLVSTVSVYARNDQPGADESADLLTPDDPGDYGKAKVLAEMASRSRMADRLLIVRPGLIVGPGDPSDRFGYWSARLSAGGLVLTPESAGRFVQMIDVSDLADFVSAAGRRNEVGCVNAVGDSLPMGDFFETATSVSHFDGELDPAPDEWLVASGVNYWAGPFSLPLWLPRADAAFAQRSNAAFLAAGGSVRGLDETVGRVLDDEVARGLDRPRRSGLTRGEERALLDARKRPGSLGKRRTPGA